MNKIDLDKVAEWVNNNISSFHEYKAKSLENLTLEKILKKKNPYLFKAKNITLAPDLIEEILSAFLSSSEEKLFGDFLEELAIFIAGQTCSGRKSAATGIDLEFVNDNIHYLISIKSGPNWGNSSQQKKQEENFKTAVRVVKQSNHSLNVQPVLGICYGKTKTGYVRGYLKIVGQNFWYFISGSKDLYTDIIEPLGYKAKQHNEKFIKQRDKIINQFVEEFLKDYCKEGIINWPKIVKLNSGNFDLDKTLKG